jgi:hypothetical protein
VDLFPRALNVLIWQMLPSLTLEEFTRKSLLQWGFLHKFNMKNCFATTEILLALIMLLLILRCGINSFDMLRFCEFSAKEKQIYFVGTVQLVLLRLKHKTFSDRVKFVSNDYRICCNRHSDSQNSKSTNTS